MQVQQRDTQRIESLGWYDALTRGGWRGRGEDDRRRRARVWGGEGMTALGRCESVRRGAGAAVSEVYCDTPTLQVAKVERERDDSAGRRRRRQGRIGPLPNLPELSAGRAPLLGS